MHLEVVGEQARIGGDGQGTEIGTSRVQQAGTFTLGGFSGREPPTVDATTYIDLGVEPVTRWFTTGTRSHPHYNLNYLSHPRVV